MALKGELFWFPAFRIIQVVKKGMFLMTLGNEGDFISAGIIAPIYMGIVTPKYKGNTEYIDNQLVSIVGEVVGTYQYETTSSALKTVPTIKIYGIKPYNRE